MLCSQGSFRTLAFHPDVLSRTLIWSHRKHLPSQGFSYTHLNRVSGMSAILNNTLPQKLGSTTTFYFL